MTTSQQSRTAPKKAPGFGIGNFHARSKTVVHGGPIKGPGTGTSDSVPVLASHGEFMFPADSVRTIGKDVLQAMVDATHKPTGKRQLVEGIPAFADGGLVQDPLNPSNNRTLAPAVASTVSAPGIAATGPAVFAGSASKPPTGVAPVASPAALASQATPPMPTAAPPVDYVNRNDAFNKQAIANTAASRMVQPMARIGQTAPAQAVPGMPLGAVGGLGLGIAPQNPVALPASPVSYENRNAAFNQTAMANTAASRMSQPLVRPGQAPGLGLGIGAGRPAAPAAPAPYTNRFAGQQDPLRMADGGSVDDELLRRVAAARQPGFGIGPTAQLGGEVIGRRPSINMGAADVVQPQGLPRPAGLPATVASTGVAQTPMPMGQRPPINMGMADVVKVPPLGVGATSAPAGAPMSAPAANAPAGRARALAAPAAALAGIAGAAQSIDDISNGTRERFQRDMGVETPLGSVAADAARTLANVGDAATFGLAGRTGRGLASMAGGDGFVSGFVGSADQAAPAVPNSAPAIAPGGLSAGGTGFGVRAPYSGGDGSARLGVRAPYSGGDGSARLGLGMQGGNAVQPPAAAPVGAVTKDGNAHSGANIAGDVTINGRAAAPVGYVQADGVSSADRVAAIERDTAHIREMSARRIADGSPDQLVRGGGMAVFGGRGGAGTAADETQKFFDEANLRTAAAKGSWSPRGGYKSDDAAIAAAMVPITARNKAAQTAASEAGATQRAVLAERGADARARTGDQVQRERLGMEQQRINLDANRDGREQAASARTAQLDELILNGTPDQQRQAASQKAALSGRELTGSQPPAGYQRTADGNLAFIKGGPADPDVKVGSGKPMPASAAKGLLDNATNLRRAQTASSLLNGETVDGVVGDRDATGYKGMLPNGILNRLDSGGVPTRAAIADLGSLVIHDRSGAAVTAAEMPRLAPLIPSASDDADTARMKTALFVKNYQAMVDDQTNFYREMGYRVPTDSLATGNADAPQATSPAQPPALLELQRRAASNPALAAALKNRGY